MRGVGGVTPEKAEYLENMRQQLNLPKETADKVIKDVRSEVLGTTSDAMDGKWDVAKVMKLSGEGVDISKALEEPQRRNLFRWGPGRGCMAGCVLQCVCLHGRAADEAPVQGRRGRLRDARFQGVQGCWHVVCSAAWLQRCEEHVQMRTWEGILWAAVGLQAYHLVHPWQHPAPSLCSTPTFFCSPTRLTPPLRTRLLLTPPAHTPPPAGASLRRLWPPAMAHSTPSTCSPSCPRL